MTSGESGRRAVGVLTGGSKAAEGYGQLVRGKVGHQRHVSEPDRRCPAPTISQSADPVSFAERGPFLSVPPVTLGRLPAPAAMGPQNQEH
ncbi:MAG TPA: hypothetical protein VGL46_15180 [Pseudonocardiaceae bacterium]